MEEVSDRANVHERVLRKLGRNAHEVHSANEEEAVEDEECRHDHGEEGVHDATASTAVVDH